MAKTGDPKSVVMAVVFFGLVGFFWFNKPDDTASAPGVSVATQATPAVEQSPAELAEAEAARVAAAEQDARDQKYGFTCLSVWDGSHDRFVDAVQATLNDPDSFEHDETKTWPVNAEGRNTILMQFRAKNGFGGIVRGKASGSFDNATCDDIRVDLIE